MFGRSVLGSQMVEFNQIITELWPLTDVQNCVLLNIILTIAQILIFFFVTKYPVAEYVGYQR